MANKDRDSRAGIQSFISRFMMRTFASLAVPNYRYWFFGALVSNIGTWMQRTSQDWLVLTELTDHSSSALGIVTALQFLGIPLLAPWAGAVADRFLKRQLLMVTQMALGLNALALFVLVITDQATLGHVYILAVTQGIIAAFDNPARQAFVSEMVGNTRLPNAVGLNSMSFNSARIIGPGLAGLIIAGIGIAPGMLINTLSFAATLFALMKMNADELHPAPQRRGSGSVAEGLRYIASRPDLMLIMLVAFMLGTFGMNFQITNATMATAIFGRGAADYGLLGTIMAIGTFGGALLAARRERPRMRYLLVALALFAVFETSLALTPSYASYAFLLMPTGLCALTAMTTSNASVQLSSDPDKRGRVMAIYAAINMGGTPIGAPIIGWIGDVWGPRWSLAAGGIITGITAIAVLIFFIVHKRLRMRLELCWPPKFHIWEASEVRATEQSAQPD